MKDNDVIFALLILEKRLEKSKDALLNTKLSLSQERGVKEDIKLLESAIKKIKEMFCN
ncbi:hypothetical protein [Metabacillus litoralis]|uniref:hypothetical protein n=1 Tax=Metabacillus litoralis TaxID=152268 RepID=UPI002040ECDD|nr:hypothetical protein [Metabacillus litoralis]MCM3411492.1 hypothetical protein [Metabacillus litoralis]